MAPTVPIVRSHRSHIGDKTNSDIVLCLKLLTFFSRHAKTNDATDVVRLKPCNRTKASNSHNFDTMSLFPRSSSLLLVCLIFALHAPAPRALQVSAAGPRRQQVSHRENSHQTRFFSIQKRQDQPKVAARVPFQLHTYTGGAEEALDYSSERSASKRRAILRWSAAAAVVVLASTTPVLKDLFQSYNHCLTTNPLRTKVLTGAVLATLGDALAQSGDKSKPYDSRRAASFAAFDSCYRVFQHIAFPLIIGKCQGRVLSSILSNVPGVKQHVAGMTQALAVSERVFTYQMMVVPLLYYPVFFTWTGLVQGLTVKQSFDRARANFLRLWKKNLCFWVPVQAFMFALVPTRWQVSFTAVMGIIWSCILSLAAGKANSS